MKRIFRAAFISAAALLSSNAMAQPTLTAATSVPAPGTTLRVLHTTSTTTATSMAGSSGAAQTWDISDRSFTRGTDTLNYHACGNGDACDRYPGTTIVSSHPQVGGVFFDYYAGSSTVLSRTGSNDSLRGVATNHINTNPQDILRFPMTYNSSFVDSFSSFDSIVNASIRHYKSGNDTVLADAWGTLKTPSGTFANTLRVKEIIHVRDSNINGPFLTIDTQRYMVYSWYDAAHAHYLGQVLELEIALGSYAQVAFYADVPGTATSVASPGVAASAFSLVPNPAHGTVALSLHLATPSDVDVAITDITNRIAYHAVYLSLPAGNTKLALKTQGLSTGLYIVRLNAGGMITSNKLIVE